MNKRVKLIFSFLGIIAITAVSLWVVLPSGSRINLNPIKIPYEKVFKARLGLDLQGGSHLVYEANFKDIPLSDQADALDAVRDTIERRVNSFGVSEPQVQISGTNRIIIELPGVKDINEAIQQIGQTPFLDFRIQSQSKTSKVTPDEKGNVVVDTQSLWEPTGLSGKQLKRATVDFQTGSSITNETVVRLEFNDEGKKLFSKITSENIGKPVAIFLDGKILSTPTVQTAITNGTAVISGNFSTEEAKLLATRLNSGALPVPIKLISQQNVGATLGKESVQKSMVAGLIGLLAIALFMISYYRFPGFLAVASLIIYALITFSVFKIGISFIAVVLVGLFFFLGITSSFWFGILALLSYVILIFLNGVSPVTLTLAGIAGFILSVGMAVDANILIFERFKEELRAGKALERAVEDGFDRAWLSIRDSNVSSLITTIILFIFGTPAIKGFAITLGIGILISMFTAITVTRTFLRLSVFNRILMNRWTIGIKDTKKDV